MDYDDDMEFQRGNLVFNVLLSVIFPLRAKHHSKRSNVLNNLV